MRFLDTTFLIDLLAGDRHAVERSRSLQASGELLATAAPCVAEVVRGAQRTGATKIAAAEALIERLEVVPLDARASLRAGLLAAEAQERGREVPMVDCLIAGIVVESGGVLLSRDADFSRVPSLTLETY